MTAASLVRRAAADRDVEEAVAWYSREAGATVALRFIGALEAAYLAIARDPELGSGRYAFQQGLEGLRFRQLDRFPYLVFYRAHGDCIEVGRVLHGHRDIPREPADLTD